MARGNKNPSPATRFKPGNNGRPKEARDRLGRAFLYGLAADFDKDGIKAIEAVREKDPATYMRVIASILPKEIEITRPLDGLQDSELLTAIETLTDAMRAAAPPAPAEADEPRVMQ